MTDEQRQDANITLTKLSEYFIPKRNKIYERYVFNSRSQKADESFEQFLTALRKLAATCEFGTFEDEMLRDRIVTDLRDHGHRERLLRESTLTLEKAIDICRTNEMAASQRHKMEQSGTIHFTREEKKRGTRENPRRHPRPTRPCKYCGDTHAAGNCPAYGKTCSRCHKKNHLAKVCQSTSKQDSKKSKPERKKPGKHQRVNQLQQDQPPDELSSDESIFTLLTPQKDKKQYVALVLVSANKEEKPVSIKFQVDTGASCSTLTLRDYKRITSTIPDQSSTKLKLYDQSVIHPVGSTKLYCTVNDLTKKVHFEIVEHASTSLLSGRASEALQLIHFNQEYLMQVNHSSYPSPLNQEQVLHEYHDVFSGLGKLPGTYHIDLDPNVKAVQENPRRVPIPVKDELKRKINELEAMSVIAKVTKPTPWISNMVVVRKPNKLRLCLDPLHLNKAIIRNHYPTPTVEDIAPKLTKAKVFSVVDAKDGFLQVVLDEPSSYLTTFTTPFGRYRWLRKPFGIKSAPEEF